MFLTEAAQCFGGGLKANALAMYFARNIKPKAELISDARANGLDPIECVTFSEGAKSSKCLIWFGVFQHIFLVRDR